MMDYRTMVLLGIMIGGLLSAYFGVLALSMPQSPWLRNCCAASLLLLTAYPLLLLRGQIHPLLSVLLSNLLIVISITAICGGIDMLMRRRRPGWVYLLFPILLVLSFGAIGFSEDRILPRQIAVSAIYLVIFAIMSGTIFGRLPARNRLPFAVTGAVALTSSAFQFFRIIFTMISLTHPDARTIALNWSLIFSGALALMFIMNLCLILLSFMEIQNVLENSVQKLDETNRERKRMISILSHDLRGSMELIETMFGTFLDRYSPLLSPESSEYMRKLHDLSRDQRDMLTNVLYWLQTQREGILPRRSGVALSLVVSELRAIFVGMAETKRINMTFRIPGDGNLFTDGEMLKAVLRNLLSNALKFTPQGGNIRFEAENEGADTVFRVTDDGSGFDTTLLDSGTNCFTRSVGTAGEKGTGLGLQICLDFAERLSGSLFFRSSPDSGTEAILRIPSGEEEPNSVPGVSDADSRVDRR
jgi:signal transduction histidine kinase